MFKFALFDKVPRIWKCKKIINRIRRFRMRFKPPICDDIVVESIDQNLGESAYKCVALSRGLGKTRLAMRIKAINRLKEEVEAMRKQGQTEEEIDTYIKNVVKLYDEI